MISLAFPKETENNYYFFAGAAFGPYGLDGSTMGENVEFTLKEELMEQGHGKYHENSVGHDHFDGLFCYNPIFDNDKLLATPTAQFPNMVTAQLVDNYALTGTRTANLGVISGDRVTSISFNSTLQYVSHYEYYQAGNLWHWYKVEVNLATPDRVYQYFHYECQSVDRASNGRITAYYKLTVMKNEDLTQSGWTIGGWNGPARWGAIQSIQPAIVSSTTNVVFKGYSYADLVPNKFNPRLGIHFVSMLVEHLFPGLYPLEDVHYGDLAMAASKKVIYNNVNMLQFLRELRHPERMIPRLKNLKSLKSWSNDFLSVKYGATLTIADLKRIWGAFEKVKPYLDRNGFKTFSAGHLATLEEGNKTYRLEQHIKLGIENEDNALHALIQGMENIGVYPTAENLYDMIPYTFVLDWFVQIGNFLERFDTRERLARLNIRYVTMSRKATIIKRVYSSIGSPYSGEAIVVRYHRWVDDQCPLPPLSLTANITAPSHWLEAAALIISRKR